MAEFRLTPFARGDHGKRRSPVTSALLIAVLSVLMGIAIWYAGAVYRVLSKQPVYASLQQLDTRYRSQALDTPVRLRTSDGLRVVVLGPGDPTSPYVWIATNADDDAIKDGVFHVGDVRQAETPCRTLIPILNDPTTLASVKTYLRHSCRS